MDEHERRSVRREMTIEQRVDFYALMTWFRDNIPGSNRQLLLRDSGPNIILEIRFIFDTKHQVMSARLYMTELDSMAQGSLWPKTDRIKLQEQLTEKVLRNLHSQLQHIKMAGRNSQCVICK